MQSVTRRMCRGIHSHVHSRLKPSHMHVKLKGSDINALHKKKRKENLKPKISKIAMIRQHVVEAFKTTIIKPIMC